MWKWCSKSNTAPSGKTAVIVYGRVALAEQRAQWKTGWETVTLSRTGSSSTRISVDPPIRTLKEPHESKWECDSKGWWITVPANYRLRIWNSGTGESDREHHFRFHYLRSHYLIPSRDDWKSFFPSQILNQFSLVESQATDLIDLIVNKRLGPKGKVPRSTCQHSCGLSCLVNQVTSLAKHLLQHYWWQDVEVLGAWANNTKTCVVRVVCLYFH